MNRAALAKKPNLGNRKRQAHGVIVRELEKECVGRGRSLRHRAYYRCSPRDDSYDIHWIEAKENLTMAARGKALCRGATSQRRKTLKMDGSRRAPASPHCPPLIRVPLSCSPADLRCGRDFLPGQKSPVLPRAVHGRAVRRPTSPSCGCCSDSHCRSWSS